MRRRRLKKNKALCDINVVPFIDVMLVLLVIFMVAAPLLTTGIKVQLPQASSKALKQSKPWTISIKPNNKIFINHNNKPVSLQSMQQSIQAQLNRNPKQQFLLQADKNSKYNQVVKLLATMQQAGAKSIGMLTKPT